MKLICNCIKSSTRHGHGNADDADDSDDGADADDADDGADEDGGNFVTGVHLVCAGSCYRLGFMLSCLGGLQIQQRNVDHHQFEEFDIKNKERIRHQTKTNTETEHTNKVETVTDIKEMRKQKQKGLQN